MKKFIRVCLAVIMVSLSYSCNDEFLERKPLSRISAESFWNTENDLKVYNNSIYHLARSEDNVPILMGNDEGFDSQSKGFWHLSGFSDDTAPRHSRHDFLAKTRAGKHTIPNTPDWFGYKGWNFLRAINVGMDNYGKAQVTDAIRNKYIGEARLLRGWFYADKVSKYGDMQWVDKELGVEDEDILYGSRDPRDFVMGKVLEDLEFAVANLPANWGDGGAPGRLNRWAALAVLSRVCLFEGTWRKYHGLADPNTWLQKSANAAKEIMDMGPYSLYKTGNPNVDYNAIHRLKDLSGVKEVLYWRRYEAGIFTNHAMSYHKDYNGGATKSLVEDYLCTDGLPSTLSPLYKGDAVYEDIFENRDPRLRQTIMHPADQPIYNYGNHAFSAYTYPRIQGMAGGLTIATGYHIIKTFEVGAAYATYNTSTTPSIVLRFGEVLLNYAEATAELGTITQADLDASINKLRDRVGMPNMVIGNIPVDPRYTSDGVSPLIVEIRRERRIELFMEGFRYDDLRRWKQGKKLEVPDYGMRWDDANQARFDPAKKATIKTTVLNGVPYLDIYKGTDYAVPVFDEGKHYLWPLPISAISQNPNLGQNPGWGSN